MKDEQRFDDEHRSEQPPEDKPPEDRKNKIGFWSLICAVAFFFMGLLEVCVMDFFTVKFTVIFVSVMGSLSAASFIVWFISNRKTH